MNGQGERPPERPEKGRKVTPAELKATCFPSLLALLWSAKLGIRINFLVVYNIQTCKLAFAVDNRYLNEAESHFYDLVIDDLSEFEQTFIDR